MNVNGNCPLPPILQAWRDHKLSSVENWENDYTRRMEAWEGLLLARQQALQEQARQGQARQGQTRQRRPKFFFF